MLYKVKILSNSNHSNSEYFLRIKKKFSWNKKWLIIYPGVRVAKQKKMKIGIKKWARNKKMGL